jgi:hypothetical protein
MGKSLCREIAIHIADDVNLRELIMVAGWVKNHRSLDSCKWLTVLTDNMDGETNRGRPGNLVNTDSTHSRHDQEYHDFCFHGNALQN